jgi:F-type H+-transporting ATPase subunit epsilon
MDVSIVSAEREVWRGEADLVVARSPEGEFGIMRGHIPFLAALVPGLVKISGQGVSKSFLITGGFLEASGPQADYHVIVLADDAEEVGDIDDAELTRRLEAAREAKADQRRAAHGDAEVRASMGQ